MKTFSRLITLLLAIFVLLSCDNETDNQPDTSGSINNDYLIIGVDNDSFETTYFNPPLDINAALARANTLVDQKTVPFNSIFEIGILNFNFWYYDSIGFKPDTVQDTIYGITNYIESYTTAKGGIAVAAKVRNDTIYGRPNANLDSAVVFNLLSDEYRELIDLPFDFPYQERGIYQYAKRINQVLQFAKGDTVYLKDTEDMEFDDDAYFNYYLTGKLHEAMSLRPKIEFIDQLEEKYLFKNVQIKNEFWPIGTRKFVFAKDFFSSHAPGVLRFKYGWIEIEIIDRTHAKIHSVSRMTSNKGYLFEDFE